MNTKNRLIEKLLKVAKKHKILTYPVLALVALISIFSYFFDWSTGAGKRVVAVVMVMVMLVSQSYFLTSSATEVADNEQTLTEQENIQNENKENVDDTESDSEETTTEQATQMTTAATDEPDIEEPASTEAVSTTEADNTNNMPGVTENGDNNTEQTEEVATTESTRPEIEIDTQANGDLPMTIATEDQVQCVFICGKDNTIVNTNNIYATKSDNTYTVSAAEISKVNEQLSAYTEDNYYECEGWYFDSGCTQRVSNTTDGGITFPSGSNYIKPGAQGKYIQFYAKRTLKKYKVSIDGAGAESYKVNDQSVTGSSSTCDVEIKDGQATLVITEMKKTGYKVLGANYKVGSSTGEGEFVSASGGDSATISIPLKGNDKDYNVILKWEGEEYKIYYAVSDEEDAATVERTLVFGSENEKWADPDGIVEEKDGYAFNHWKVETDSGSSYEGNQGETIDLDLKKELYNSYKAGEKLVIVPVYKYAGIECMVPEIVYEYEFPDMDTFNIIGTYIGSNKSGDFKYTMKTESTDGWAALYGIVVQIDESKGVTVCTSSTGPKEVKDLEFEFTITDESSYVKVEDKQEPLTVKVPIKIVPRKVTIREYDEEEQRKVFSKVYDGTTDCKVKEALETNVEGVTVTYDSAKYDEANAGDRTVTLSGTKLNKADDPKVEEHYVLVSGATVAGEITRRPVFVKTSPNYPSEKREYARAGEKFDPSKDLNVEVETSTGSIEGTGLLPQDKDKWKDWANPYLDPERPDGDTNLSAEKPEMDYKIHVEPAPDSNYRFVVDDANSSSTSLGTYRVVLESPERGANYWIYGEPNSNGWYGSKSNAQIRPIKDADYDQIQCANGSWSDVLDLTDANTKNGEVTFRLGDTNTGAYTSWTTIDIDVDLTAPEYIGYTLEEGGVSAPGNGLYFPSEQGAVSFGNYFNKTVRFVIKYQDERSHPNKLYYTLFGTLGNSDGEKATANFTEADAEGYATASFEILATVAKDRIGTIQFYADDKAGNESEEMTMTGTGHGTEWAVEQSGPTIDKFAVKSGEITVHNNDGFYYSDCTAYVTATDATSGIYGVTWHVNDQTEAVRVPDTSKKQTTADFTLKIDENHFPTAADKQGQYAVYADITDNAGNTKTTDTIHFMVDDVPPILLVDDGYDVYTEKAVVTFKTYDELSGIDHIDVYDAEGRQCRYSIDETYTENGYSVSACTFETSVSGTYRIVAVDKAGNKAEKIINLNKISSEIPDCPSVTLDPEPNDKDWITVSHPVIHITNVKETKNDKMGVTTYYEVWNTNGNKPMTPSAITSSVSDAEVTVPEDGIYNVHVWSESLTGVLCYNAENHLYTVQVDSQAPAVEYTVQRGTNNSRIVNFTITDSVSGVDKESIKIMHGSYPVLPTITETENGYSGSFEITEAGSYTIQAADIAGNVADVQAFTPMSMRVNAVRNITESAATVGARIFKGTFDIQSASIVYRKVSDAEYTEATSLVENDDNGNWNISSVLSDLTEGTDYVYKITAVSEGDEVIEYEGYFRTISTSETGVTITGTARYADEEQGNITVDLVKGNYCIRAIHLNTEDTTEFTFYNVPDGSYNLTATDGTYTRTIRVVVADGKLVYPESGVIDLVLTRVSTSVEVQNSETPNISADFVDIEETMSDNDKTVISEGGSVEYQLTASLTKPLDIGNDVLSAVYVTAGNNKIVGAYLDLKLYKIVTDQEGNVTKEPVHKLGGGAEISVTIPLGDLAGKPGLTVVRVHQNGDSYTGKQLADMDFNPSTYTVTTTQFSTYAVLYDKPEEDVPNTEEDNTETDSPNTGSSQRGEAVVNSNNRQSVNKSAKAVEIAAKTKTAKATTTSSSVGSLRSSSTAKTGDEAPVAAVGVIFIMTMGGLVILRRKTR